MKKIELTVEEKSKISSIFCRYQDLYAVIDNIEKKLISLSNEKNILLSDLNKLREEEKFVTKEIIDKYGTGKLNIKNLEYELD